MSGGAREPGPRARFDDARSNPGRSFRLGGFVGLVQANDPTEVRPAIAEVARAVDGGLWAAGFVAYEAAPGFDPALTVRDPLPGMPLVSFGLFERREEASAPDAMPGPGSYRLTPWAASVERADYEATVETIRGLIAAGETYQVNHTFRLRAAFEGDDLALYRDLCLAQRSAHCALLRLGRFHVLSASPELFFRIDGDVVTARPMKGTARRGRWPDEDRAAAASLTASEKDRAENAMIVDLIRNDLGRIAVPGSVTVPAMYEAERYETVWQLTSTVRARRRPDTGLPGVFAALFPCGSVTGAPKARTMRAIAELEGSPRGVYTGAVGWLAPPGTEGPSACFNVAIRTVVVDTETKRAEFGVGGGITWDSSPAGEYDECRAKALVLTERRPEMELLEALRYEPGSGFALLDGHLRRLAGSAEYFGFALDEGAVRRELSAATGQGDEALRVRLTLSRDGTLRVKAEPLPPPPSAPVRLGVHADPVRSSDPLLFHKTTLRQRFEHARAAHPEADDVLLVNERGEVTESTIANVAVRLDGRWWTPPLDAGLLAGVRRSQLVVDGTLGERPVIVDDLRRAEALALVSSVRGWRDATLV
ncbi:MAG TPA: aminodeoxychorismate synthase component I [Actinomycetota bacterium]